MHDCTAVHIGAEELPKVQKAIADQGGPSVAGETAKRTNRPGGGEGAMAGAIPVATSGSTAPKG